MAGGRGYDGINGLDDPVKGGVRALKKDYDAIINREINIVAIFYLRHKIKKKARNYGAHKENRKGIDRTLYLLF
jgi:hypothetical protein